MGLAPLDSSMGDADPDRTNPLSPYYPSETPSLPSNGRAWFALLVVGMLLLGVCYAFLSLFFAP